MRLSVILGCGSSLPLLATDEVFPHTVNWQEKRANLVNRLCDRHCTYSVIGILVFAGLLVPKPHVSCSHTYQPSSFLLDNQAKVLPLPPENCHIPLFVLTYDAPCLYILNGHILKQGFICRLVGMCSRFLPLLSYR